MNALVAALDRVPVDTRALAVGYSGGLDSTALLHALAHHADPARPVRAIHVCHHLQPQAPAWAVRCAAQCRAWEVAFTQLDIHVEPSGQGLEAAARAARYDALEAELAAGETLVTAHHARDQAETFLLQALRGAGVDGLAAMPVLGALGSHRHWRPWLGCEHGLIDEYAAAQALDWIEDPSNADADIDRSYLRHRVLPALQARWPAFARTLSRSARHAAAASELVGDLAQQDLDGACDSHGALGIDALAALSPARKAQLLRRWLASAGRDVPDHRHLEQIRALAAARLAASPVVRFAGTEVRLFDRRLFCMGALAPAPRAALDWDPCRALQLPAGCGWLSAELGAGAAGALRVAFRRGGERIVDRHGRRHALKDVLRECRVAPWIRRRMPLVYRGDCLLAVADLWRHPEIERMLGVPVKAIRWDHGLVGSETRVVAAGALG